MRDNVQQPVSIERFSIQNALNDGRGADSFSDGSGSGESSGDGPNSGSGGDGGSGGDDDGFGGRRVTTCSFCGKTSREVGPMVGQTLPQTSGG